MKSTSGGLARTDARLYIRGCSEANPRVMDDDKPPENAFRDALVAFAKKYAKKL